MVSGLDRIPPTPVAAVVVSQEEADSDDDGDSAYHFCVLATGTGGHSEAPGYNGNEPQMVPGNAAKLVYG
jgi:hypothetical protein